MIDKLLGDLLVLGIDLFDILGFSFQLSHRNQILQRIREENKDMSEQVCLKESLLKKCF